MKLITCRLRTWQRLKFKVKLDGSSHNQCFLIPLLVDMVKSSILGIKLNTKNHISGKMIDIW
jgi:hypothetical protein